MDDEPILKNKKWKDLKLSQKIIFSISMLAMIGTLLFIGLNFDKVMYETYVVSEKTTGCEFTFSGKDYNFTSITCYGDGLKIANLTGKLVPSYTYIDFYYDYLETENSDIYGLYDANTQTENFNISG